MASCELTEKHADNYYARHTNEIGDTIDKLWEMAHLTSNNYLSILATSTPLQVTLAVKKALKEYDK